jgi:hypothetical protein
VLVERLGVPVEKWKPAAKNINVEEEWLPAAFSENGSLVVNLFCWLWVFCRTSGI